METSVNINKLRKGIRYTFIDKKGNKFRAIFDEYQSLNNIKNMAMRLSCVTNVQGNIYLHGHLHIPLHFISKVSIYTMPNKTLSYFQYLLPEVNLIVNQYI